MEPQSKETDHWQCRACSGKRVTDRLLGVAGDVTEVRRLKCEDCGAVSHYDLKRGGHRPSVRSTDHFLWIPGTGATP